MPLFVQIAMVPGSSFSPSSTPSPYLRCSFTQCTPEVSDITMQRFAEAIRWYHANPKPKLSPSTKAKVANAVPLSIPKAIVSKEGENQSRIVTPAIVQVRVALVSGLVLGAFAGYVFGKWKF
jgi:hypothetical protein